jgi:hypothetical protein
MDGAQFLADVIREHRRLKRVADASMAQVPRAALFTRIDAECNSIAILMKHMAGNMRSRWRGFLTTDGEKSDRERDAEFKLLPGETAEVVLESWEAGWQVTFDALQSLTPRDLTRTVTIRGEAHLVTQAIQRSLTHYAYHVGQIVYLARHLVGPEWITLSIARDRSSESLSKPPGYLSEG